MDLFDAAKAASEKCHAPYSKYPVGAAIRTASGAIHAGCNIEVVSFPEGWCAETSAIAHMVMAGEHEISEVAVFAPRGERATPCGGCRQRLAEFSTGATKVHLCDAAGIVETLTMAELLPHAFDMETPA
ncbi:cytidine deaminase [Rhizobiaceae bacterium]|nr:cytidine deaminase [Rhizobiaceae bacterium]